MLDPSQAQVVNMQIHTTRETWLVAVVWVSAGPPICPKDKVEMEALGDWEDI